MISITSRGLLTLLAGGSLCGAVHAQLPAGFDSSRLPSGVDTSRLPSSADLSRLPAGVNVPQIPAGTGLPQLPAGANFPQIPAGMSLPAGIDPSQFPGGLEIPAGAGGYFPGGSTALPTGQGVAFQGGGGGGGNGGVTGGGNSTRQPRNRPKFALGLDLQEVVEQQFRGVGDDVTYTEVSGDLGVQIKNRRIVASGTYRVSYRIPERGKIGKSFTQNGVMRAQATVIRDLLTMDTGVIVTRSRVDPGGAAPQTNSANAKNLTQTYSTFVQPTVSHHFGELGFNAVYRYAYTKNSGKVGAQAVGARPVNRFDDSISHQVSTSVGMKRSELPFDWKASLEYARENASSLAKHTRSFNAAGEITLPVSGSLALVSSGGYERIRISERPPLLDSVTGIPVTDGKGRFIADPATPRVMTYEISGIIADAGVIWRPSSRTRLEMRAGYRYDDLTVTGLFEMKFSDRTGLTFILTDRIESFGQSVSGGLAAAPVELDLTQSSDPNSSFQNCLFGKGAGTGRCVGGALSQASASNYRERSGSLIFSHRMRRWSFSTSGGYSRRTYIDTPGTVLSLAGVVDQNFFAELQMSGILSRQSGISFSFRGNLFKNGQAGQPNVTSGSFSSNYYRTFGQGIRLQANMTLDASKQDGMTADVSGRAQLGLQYQF